MSIEMKRILSLLFAVASATFLAVGAANAAEKFDTLSNSGKITSFSDTVMDGPALPCLGGGEEDPV